jgi:hypothetical protein
MTTTLSPTQVRCREDGRLTARCTWCGTELVQAPDADVRSALAALDRDHPARTHGRTVPAGWLTPGADG